MRLRTDSFDGEDDYYAGQNGDRGGQPALRTVGSVGSTSPASSRSSICTGMKINNGRRQTANDEGVGSNVNDEDHSSDGNIDTHSNDNSINMN
eukprot:CAMPEP_0202115612 /NCGR_PEP_ID=MMETSP0965-20130614/38800_1 /ASSEMBLY_ACC=CAM_ASM_000507 /TAXON_ID=4773 /ORGANISM="Schizochytrium aggregatum, Strain ATCC28209" /LENGTH=92 /DNA_ID=CAMNT_0048685419 /DNA_START=1 /DNA_END=276 /DNA_ORIENTATION=+